MRPEAMSAVTQMIMGSIIAVPVFLFSLDILEIRKDDERPAWIALYSSCHIRAELKTQSGLSQRDLLIVRLFSSEPSCSKVYLAGGDFVIDEARFVRDIERGARGNIGHEIDFEFNEAPRLSIKTLNSVSNGLIPATWSYLVAESSVSGADGHEVYLGDFRVFGFGLYQKLRTWNSLHLGIPVWRLDYCVPIGSVANTAELDKIINLQGQEAGSQLTAITMISEDWGQSELVKTAQRVGTFWTEGGKLDPSIVTQKTFSKSDREFDAGLLRVFEEYRLPSDKSIRDYLTFVMAAILGLSLAFVAQGAATIMNIGFERSYRKRRYRAD